MFEQSLSVMFYIKRNSLH